MHKLPNGWQHFLRSLTDYWTHQHQWKWDTLPPQYAEYVWVNRSEYEITRNSKNLPKRDKTVFEKENCAAPSPKNPKTTMFWSNIKLVCWKTALVAKRHPIWFAIRALLPIALFVLCTYIRNKTGLSMKEDYVAKPTLFEPKRVPGAVGLGNTYLGYAPEGLVQDKVMELIQIQLQLTNDRILKFPNEQAMVEHYDSLQEPMFGIIFNGNQSKKLDYTIRGSMELVQAKNSKLYEKDQDLHFFSEAYTESFMDVEALLGKSYIDVISGKDLSDKIVLKTEAFPFPPYKPIRKLSQEYFNQNLALFTVFGFFYLFTSLISGVVSEKETGVRELLKMVGMKSWMLWFGWSIYILVPVLLAVPVIVVLLTFPVWSGDDFATLQFVNKFIFMGFLFAYIIGNMFFCFALSTLFNKSSWAVSGGGLLILVTYFLPSYFLKKYTINIVLRFICGLIPNMALEFGFSVINLYEELGTGVQWNNFYESPSGDSRDFSLLEVFLMFFTQVKFYGFLVYYIANVNPGPFGIRRSFIFPLIDLKQFIRKWGNSTETAPEVRLINMDHVEKGEGLQPGLQLCHVKKKFEKFVAVDDLSLDVYKNRITILLGHNGAGKSTVMSMITGMLPATAGTIRIDGRKITENIDEIRNQIGLCPQHNMYFDYLTVKEHLIFFSVLKGSTFEEAAQEADQLLKDLGMETKATEWPSNLSGGMKRKLCLGMAVIGKSKILILDEPTSGMDPESRRKIWDMLLSWRKSKTILLTTHFMEEADALGDWIAIMCSGKLQCYGTPMFLKSKYESGYHLSVVQTIKDQSLNEQLTSCIKSTIPTAVLVNRNGTTSVYLLPISQKDKFVELFYELERQKHAYKIDFMSVTITTLEDVFLKTNSDTVDSKQQASEIQKVLNETKIERKPTQLQNFLILWSKRWYFFKRTLPFYFLSAFLTFIISFVVFFQSVGNEHKVVPEQPLPLSLSLYGTTSVFYNKSQTGESSILTDFYKSIVTGQRGELYETNNVVNAILNKSIDNVEFYRKYLVVGAEFKLDDSSNIEATALYSQIAIHSAPISLNLVLNSLVKFFLGDSYSVSLSGQAFTSLEEHRVVQSIYLGEVLLIWMFFIPFGFSLFVAIFLLFPHKEMACKFNRVQFMCGVPPLIYWLVTLVFDVLFTQPVIIIFLVIASCMEFFHFTEIMILWTILLVYTLAALPFEYLFSRKKSFTSAYSWIVATGPFLCVVPTILIVLSSFATEYWKSWGDILKGFMLIMHPYFGLSINCLQLSLKAFQNYQWDLLDTEEKMITCSAKPTPCCTNDTLKCAEYRSYGEVMYNLFLMMICMLGYFTINVLMDNISVQTKLHRSLDHIFKLFHNHQHNFNGPKENNSKDNTLNAFNLNKCYHKIKAVQDVTFEANKGECTGMLGVNGAGKTTTFNMLTRNVIENHGNIFADNISKDDSSYLTMLGYCPQADALNMTLSPKEILLTIGRLRGISSNKLHQTIEDFLRIFELQNYNNVPCGNLSGGNKRKLCLAVALMSQPAYVLLDEPTTGVDPFSRRQLWSVLLNVKDNKNVSFILTSHSMAECEVLCDFVHIMKEGTIRKKDTVPKLKQEIGGFTLTIRVGKAVEVEGSQDTPDGFGCLDDLINDTERVFKCKVKEKYGGLVTFHISNEQVDMKLSDLFKNIEELRMKYPGKIEDYSLSEATLEDVFLDVAKSN